MQENNEALHEKLESNKKELQEDDAKLRVSVESSNRELQKLQENSDKL
jgi:hypothetical protein